MERAHLLSSDFLSARIKCSTWLPLSVVAPPRVTRTMAAPNNRKACLNAHTSQVARQERHETKREVGTTARDGRLPLPPGGRRSAVPLNPRTTQRVAICNNNSAKEEEEKRRGEERGKKKSISSFPSLLTA